MKVDHQGNIALLEFDHGKANEIGRAQLDALSALGEELIGRGTRALISFSRRMSSRGTPIFVSGANVTERAGWTPDQVAAHVRYQREVMSRLRVLPLFHVTVIHGVALGWGTEWLITADYRLATPTAAFGLPETGLGIIPGAGGAAELRGLIGLAQAVRLGMTGERIDADEALRIGLVQEKVADVDAGLARARELAALVARRSPTAVAAYKAAALASVGRLPAARREIEARAYEHCLASGDAAIGREHFAAIRDGGEVPWGPLAPFDPEE